MQLWLTIQPSCSLHSISFLLRGVFVSFNFACLLDPRFWPFLLFPLFIYFGFTIVGASLLGTKFTSSLCSYLQTSSSILNRVIRLSNENFLVLCLKVFLKSFHKGVQFVNNNSYLKLFIEGHTFANYFMSYFCSSWV